MKTFLRIPALILVLALVITALTGCGTPGGGDDPADGGINIREKMAGLMTTEDELGLEGKYELTTDVEDGYFDDELIGKWESLDGNHTYRFTDDGVSVYTHEPSMNIWERAYICLDANGTKVFGEDQGYGFTDEYENPMMFQYIQYTAYEVDGDVLYMAWVGKTEYPEDMDVSDDAYQYFGYYMTPYYRVDENGSSAAAREANPLSMESICGEWKDIMGSTVTIDESGITFGEDHSFGTEPLQAEFTPENKLAVTTADGVTEYDVDLSYSVIYTDKTRTEVRDKTYGMFLYYNMAEGDAPPNLIDVMDYNVSDNDPGVKEYFIGLECKAE